MSNPNQEIIEARLATYIDDELDIGERAEIERFLQQNPHYRRLLDDLRQGRQMLRALPRESAPTEFADAFFLQLERSGLLDGENRPSPSRLRLDAWPRWVAAAAVLFLTVGLAAIVYFVLPRHQVRTVAFIPKPIPDAIGETESRSAKPDESSPVNQIPQAGNAPEPAARASGAPQPVEATKAVESSGKGSAAGDRARAEPGSQHRDEDAPAPGNDELKELASAVSREPRVKDLLLESTGANVAANALPSASANAVVMAVRSSEPAKIERELNAYFISQNIFVQPVSRPVEMALNAALGQPQSQPGVVARPALSGDLAGPNGIKTELQKQAAKTDSVARPSEPERDAAKLTANPPSRPGQMPDHRVLAEEPGPRTASPAMARSEPSAASPSVGNVGSPSAARVSTAPPTPAAAPASHINDSPSAPASAPAIDGASRYAASAPSGSPSAPAKPGAGGAYVAPVNSFFIARRLSRAQARELTDYLARGGEVREAAVESLDGGVANENKLGDGASILAANTHPNAAANGIAARGADPASPSIGAAPAPASVDKASVRKGPDEAGDAAIAAGTTTRPSGGSSQLAPAPQLPRADALRRRALDSSSRPALVAATRSAATDAETDYFVDVVVVVRNAPSAERTFGSRAEPSTRPAEKAPSAVPTTEPAPAVSLPPVK
ncbi:MAG TPA: hypothetical protein VG326_02565 [Tepidisphaeraceae bacterium]|jgi:hypothetical protein|nr:hypothetical protein [Tepidisphaeraceae bacterium]